jgi:hypothetical protein
MARLRKSSAEEGDGGAGELVVVIATVGVFVDGIGGLWGEGVGIFESVVGG